MNKGAFLIKEDYAKDNDSLSELMQWKIDVNSHEFCFQSMQY